MAHLRVNILRATHRYLCYELAFMPWTLTVIWAIMIWTLLLWIYYNLRWTITGSKLPTGILESPTGFTASATTESAAINLSMCDIDYALNLRLCYELVVTMWTWHYAMTLITMKLQLFYELWKYMGSKLPTDFLESPTGMNSLRATYRYCAMNIDYYEHR